MFIVSKPPLNPPSRNARLPWFSFLALSVQPTPLPNNYPLAAGGWGAEVAGFRPNRARSLVKRQIQPIMVAYLVASLLLRSGKLDNGVQEQFQKRQYFVQRKMPRVWAFQTALLKKLDNTVNTWDVGGGQKGPRPQRDQTCPLGPHRHPNFVIRLNTATHFQS